MREGCSRGDHSQGEAWLLPSHLRKHSKCKQSRFITGQVSSLFQMIESIILKLWHCSHCCYLVTHS